MQDTAVNEAKLPGLSTEGFKLFIMGFITLFLELLLIRYLAGNIWNLGYFPNLVLISVFVGMGLGFTLHQLFSERASFFLLHMSMVFLLGLVLFVHFKHPTVPGFATSSGDLDGELFFTNTPAAAIEQSYLSFVVCMLSIIVVFICLSQRTAKLFRKFRPLTAYTLDISGSCAGILSFMIVSWLTIPARLWFLFFSILLLIPLVKSWKSVVIPATACLALVFIVSYQDSRLLSEPDFKGTLEVRWSPYQKVEYADGTNNKRHILVNGISHQAIINPSILTTSYYQPIYTERGMAKDLPPYKSALIIGAGSGSDVAAALVNGVEHIDAVEIDPVIAELGKTYNPVKVYDSPKVNLVIDDGRAFMMRTDKKYDLIIFALTDSLVKVSSMSQLRLENYLFTYESVRQAYSLLSEHGDLVFYNFYRMDWVIKKLEEIVKRVSGSGPRVVYKNPNGYYIMAKSFTGTAPKPEAANASIDVPTDDWPFLYIENRKIPSVYRWSMMLMFAFISMMIIILHLSTRNKEGYNSKGMIFIKLSFVFMGLAFLLLETKSVVQFSLLFGTTWLNNSLVFLSILLLVLAANWTALLIKKPSRLWIVFALLLASTLVSFVLPLSSFLQIENAFLRFTASSLMTFLPIYFANLIFSVAFRDLKIAEHIFGWNLIGATAGGVVEYLSIAFGYQFLSIVVLFAYAIVGLLLYLGTNSLRPSIGRP